MASSQPSSKNTYGEAKPAGCLKSTLSGCSSCCNSTVHSIKSLCCPTYRLYEDDENALTPVRVKAPVFNNTPPTTIVQPQVIGKVDLDADDRRSKVVAAAERREEQQRHRGIGSSDRAGILEEAHRKDELIGRITELYAANQEGPPMGLRLMTVQQLRDHYRVLKEQSNAVQQSNAI
ncbi:hypothetical protein FOL47_006400 [Perkinsus chesapeaki]|uniref:Uncharacterized protein n=1 Tax=Perkinsus chesapeaki TaxID=330153 RepID=A0A7J6LT18_PERCH|nr:hypothetical protein FOL47_006400 [Perkinsus chesapeaki]